MHNSSSICTNTPGIVFIFKLKSVVVTEAIFEVVLVFGYLGVFTVTKVKV